MDSVKFITIIGVCLIVTVPLFSQNTGGDSCICTTEYYPVCATNNQTYANKCIMGCYAGTGPCALVKAHDGNCSSPCPCTLEQNYVCGTDYITYSNECQLTCTAAKKADPCLKKAYDGPCGITAPTGDDEMNPSEE